jgi:hypothetical protein
MKMRLLILAILFAVGPASGGRSSELAKNLDIYFLDIRHQVTNADAKRRFVDERP